MVCCVLCGIFNGMFGKWNFWYVRRSRCVVFEKLSVQDVRCFWATDIWNVEIWDIRGVGCLESGIILDWGSGIFTGS